MPFDNIRACVFDAYGTLFDVHSAVGRHRERFDSAELADAVSMTWRSKQLEYTWLRSLMQRHADFWQVTGDALDYALTKHAVNAKSGADQLRKDLLDAYLQLDCYPEVPEVLAELRQRGLQTAVLSNGSPDMLASAVSGAGLDKLLDFNLSVEEVGIFKPDPRVYQLALDRLDLSAAKQVSFQSSNAWDAVAATSFGFDVAWVNRFAQPRERLGYEPAAELTTLSELPALLANH